MRCTRSLTSMIRLRARALSAQPTHKAKKDGGNHAKHERPAKDVCDLPDFIDVSSDHQHATIRQSLCNQTDRLFLPATFVHPVDYGSLHRIVGVEIGRQAFQIASDPAAV